MVSIYDTLAKIMYDEERNVEYKPWTCINDEKLRKRIVISGAMPVVYSVKAYLELNSRIAVCMKNTINSGMLELLVGLQDAEEELRRIAPDYASGSMETQLFFERPFLEATALINEMIALDYTVMQQTGAIKIEEKSGARKDRYTSLSYGNYFVEMLEQDMLSDNEEYQFCALYN